MRFVLVLGLTWLCAGCAGGVVTPTTYADGVAYVMALRTATAQAATLGEAPQIRAAIAQAQLTATQDTAQSQIAQARATDTARMEATQAAYQAAQQNIALTAAAIELAAVADAATLEAQARRDSATQVAYDQQVSVELTRRAQSTTVAIADSMTQVADDLRMASVNAQLTAQTAIWQRAENERNANSLLWIVAPFGLVFVVLAGAWAVIQAAIVKQTAETLAQADAVRMESEARANGTSTRAAVFAHNGALLVVPPALLTGPSAITVYTPHPIAPPMEHTSISIEAPQAAPAQPPMVHSARGSYPLIQDERELEIVKFLALCVDRVGDDHARIITTIPRYDKLSPMGAARWTAAVKLLEQAGLAQAIPNVGTQVIGYASLHDLYTAVCARAGAMV